MFPATIDPNSISGNSEPARKKLRVEVEVIEQELSHITEVVGGENCTEQAKSMPIVWNESTPTAVFNNGDSNMMSPNRENDFDQNLYSRQIYTLGESAMKYLRKSSVLISGMGSVGCEIAKNLILGGVRRITLHDTADVHWLDLSAHYYLDETDLGKNRAAACYGKLTKLNDSVTTELATEELTEEFVKKFDITIIAEAPFSKQKVINEWTRRNNRFFISADTAGLFAYIFVDCGPNFVTNDRTGEKCKEVLVEHIDAESGDVITLDKAIHGFESGDYVTFGEVKGMIELNDIEPIEIKVKGRDVFNIGSIAKNLSPYHEGGRAKEVKLPRKIEHLPLADSLRDPQFLTWDYAHFDYPQQLHFLWQALYSFMAMHGRRPNPRDESDLNLLKRDLRGVNSVQINEDLLKTFSYTAQGNLVPIVSIVGGFAAQEAMKLLTHHMTPLFQWLHINCEDALPGPYSDFDKSKLEPEDFEKRGTRYDGQVVVFGRKYQEALMSQNYFVVGAGAIGCELLKNLAMMGVGCSDKGEIRVTDMDQIVISNLNRQFLFRRKDIGENKALVAAKAVRQFNRGIHIKAYTERASGETEFVFGDEFYAGLNGVINALDNVDARRYMDRRCILYRLPLLESGTMGTKGNTQVVYPYLTESYSSSVDPPEKEIPICTLKNFPNQIHHTIQWARELFDSLFKEQAESAVLFHENPRQFLSRLDHMSGGQKTVVLEQLISSVSDEKMEVAEQCIVWARKLFQKLFFNAISQLLHNFPPDQVTDHGVKFWSGTKRCPHPIQFDPCKEHHFDFVYAASVLMAEQYGIRPIKDKKTFNSVVSRVEVEPFYPSSDVQISITDEEEKRRTEDSGDCIDVLMNLKIKLGKLKTSELAHPIPIEFEKDDDSNHHIEFITAASNLRAENYDIPVADRMKTKQIAGRIIPAIATTTSVVAGLIMIELYKLVSKLNGSVNRDIPLDKFKSSFFNLALPFVAFSQPIGAEKKEYNNKTFTLWDRLEAVGPLTLSGFIDWLEEETKLKVSMVSSGVSLIYSFFMSSSKRNERMSMELREVVEEVSRNKIPSHVKSIVLEVVVTDENDDDVEVPYVLFLSAPLRTASRISDDSFDGVVLVSHSADKLADYSILKTLSSPILEYLALNKNAEKSASLMKVDSSIIPSGRLIYSGTGEVAKDHYDVRSFTAAARSGMSLAISAGMKSPLLATLPHKKYEQAELVSLIGALQEIYVPLIVREKEDKKKITEFGLIGINTDSQELLSKIEAFEGSFFVCRDIGDTDPQRMTPIRVAEYVEDVFRGTCIKVHVTSDQSVLEREYPLMAAVNRCANSVEDHKARLIWLEYVPDGPIEQTLMLVGKGVTIDTGGANVKVGANMLGMSRDKYGSATVCGFFKALEVLKPKGVKVVGFMCMVRNSIGSNCYTCDEIIESRSGKRVLIGNTDAEGRLAMLDPLTRMVELAVKEKNPHLLTIATLTGHQRSSYGEYATAMDNGPAKQSKFSYSLQEYGDTYGQPIEISRLHPEDFTFNELKYDAAHFRQCNTGAGPAPRGHQTPAALLIQVSGLIDHGTDSTLPIKYTHIDMAGALGDYPCTVFPNPLVALVAGLIIPRV